MSLGHIEKDKPAFPIEQFDPVPELVHEDENIAAHGVLTQTAAYKSAQPIETFTEISWLPVQKIPG
jgi:hypothetical protein